MDLVLFTNDYYRVAIAILNFFKYKKKIPINSGFYICEINF